MQEAPESTDRFDHRDDLWGVLQPCSAYFNTIELYKLQPEVFVGQNFEQKKVVLPGLRVSNNHCTITWDGRTDEKSTVMVTDTSTNGTWINGEKIKNGGSRPLRDGNEIAFGQLISTEPLEDYRYIYRHLACVPPARSLEASYKLTCPLGHGAFATVMKAFSRATRQCYAVKIIEARKLKRLRTMYRNKQFSKEVNILSSLRHDNICQLKEVFYQEADICLVLEFVDGGTLSDYIRTQGPLKESTARHITFQIIDAVSYVHSQGIVHRDLKPDNVLLTSAEPPIVKVADFGVARAIDDKTPLTTFCGTPMYVAPEVAKQKDRTGYNNLVDSWSVGVMLFYMLTGRAPFFVDRFATDDLARVAKRKVDWKILQGARPSKEAEHLICSLLQYHPAQRMALSDAKSHPWFAKHEPTRT
ncbi:kinase-like protein [Coniophora puteana RWD-64-598 SS2]|uniref:Kinase-like protein n=1 Tax=Coniophora puteana (strain RWD-64-598) TaxID=741705 RepID=A0A5M3N308_CONPW|nr:kinase-like protein [Coniophora puteana RWD-64-598 SS2]EIW85779.1 kinase-like protein [Coniophora puteana RWD-64-598 SS2]